MRNPEERRGDLRAQLAAHHLAERRVAELCAAAAASASPPPWTSSTPTRAPRPRRDRGPPRRTLRGERRPRGAEGRPRASARRSRSRARTSRSTSPAPHPAPGQPQLPARRHPLGLLLRRPLRHRPGRARLGRRVRARDGPRPDGLARERAAAGGRRGRKRRDLLPDRRPPLRLLRPGVPVPAQGQGR